MSTPEASRKYDTVVGSVAANELPNASTPHRLPTLSAHSVSSESSRRTPSPVEPMLALSKTLEPTHGRPREIAADTAARSEEHTSELQSLMRISYAVLCL